MNRQIQDHTFARIQKHAVPLVDTIDDVINRAVDALEQTASEVTATSNRQRGEQVYDRRRPPSLKHAKLLAFSVNGESPAKINWNSALAYVIKIAAESGKSADEIIGQMTVPSCEGQSPDQSYNYVKEADVSFQGLNADRAWQQSQMIASAAGLCLSARWRWADKADAHLPGAIGTFSS